MEAFDENRLRSALDHMDPRKRIAFMVLCCERMVPNYRRFTMDSGFGDSNVLRDSLDAAWAWLASGQLPANLPEKQALVEAQAPDTAEFISPFTSAALDAANAVAAVLAALATPQEADAIEVATLARDTLDLYIQETENLNPNDPQTEEAIIYHPLMQAELQRQHDDLAELQEVKVLRGSALQRLRTARSSGGSLDQERERTRS